MELRQIIEKAWDDRGQLQDKTVQSAIRSLIERLDVGELRVAEPVSDGWKVNEWIK